MLWMRDWKPREVGWLDQVHVIRKWQSRWGVGGPRSVIIKSRAYITHTVCWAQHGGFTRIIHLMMTGAGQTVSVTCPGSHKGSGKLDWDPGPDLASCPWPSTTPHLLRGMLLGPRKRIDRHWLCQEREHKELKVPEPALASLSPASAAASTSAFQKPRPLTDNFSLGEPPATW